jgi:hypothetical protein
MGSLAWRRVAVKFLRALWRRLRGPRWDVWIREVGQSPEFIGNCRGSREDAEEEARAFFVAKVFKSGKAILGKVFVVELDDDGKPITPIREGDLGKETTAT